MRKNNTTDLLHLQGANLVSVKISKTFVEALINCLVKQHSYPCCGNTISNIHDYYECSFNHIKIGNKSSLIHYNQRKNVCTNCSKRFAESNSFITKFYRHSNDAVINVLTV